MTQRQTLIKATDQVGEASATLTRFRTLLAGAGGIDAPAVEHAALELRSVAIKLEIVSVALIQARLGAAA